MQDAIDATSVRDQIGAVETLKHYADQVHLKILRQQARCGVYLLKRYLNYMKLAVTNVHARK